MEASKTTEEAWHPKKYSIFPIHCAYAKTDFYNDAKGTWTPSGSGKMWEIWVFWGKMEAWKTTEEAWNRKKDSIFLLHCAKSKIKYEYDARGHGSLQKVRNWVKNLLWDKMEDWKTTEGTSH